MNSLTKRFKMLSVVTFAVSALTLFQFSHLAKATEADTGEITTVTEDTSPNQIFLQNVEVDLGKYEEVTEVAPYEEPLISALGVDNSTSLNLTVGDSWANSFKMNNWFSDNHNAFNVKILVTSGKYKIMVQGTNGYKYESSEYSSSKTLTITNAQSDVTYTVTIVNTSVNTLKGKVNITSYIK